MNLTKNKFPIYKLRQQDKDKILSNLKEQRIRKKQKYLYFVKAASTITITLIVIGLGFYVYNTLFNNEPPIGQHATSQDSFIVNLPDGLKLERVDNNTHIIYQNDIEVGGISKISYDDMRISLGSQGIFEVNELDSLPFPTTQTLAHVKMGNIIQTYHFYIKPNDELLYDLYFHRPPFDHDFNSPNYTYKEMIDIVKSFTLQ